MSSRRHSIRRVFCFSVGAVVSTLLVAACGSTSTESVTGPVPAKCGVTLSTSDDPVDASGGTRTVTVTTNPECAWTAAADVGWISEVAPASGQGAAGVQFRAGANPNRTAREGGITVNDQRAVVRQAAQCVQSAISNGQFAAAGGAATVTVTAPGGCAWTASASAGWINLTSPVSGSGDGTVSVAISLNTGVARSGTITVGGVRPADQPGRCDGSTASSVAELRHFTSTDVGVDAGRRRWKQRRGYGRRRL